MLALYAKVGADLTHYDVHVAGAALNERATVTLPAGVQYAWPHVSRRYLYVATSSSASEYGPAGTEHHVTAFRIDPATGVLTQHGEAIRLPTRPIDMCTDIPSENILVAFSNPSALRVHRINPDFTPGEEVKQPGPIDADIFAHQVRVGPDNRLAILVTRGNEGTATKAERARRAQSFRLQERGLTNAVSIAADGGRNFGRGISIFIRRSPGCTSRSRPRTRCTRTRWKPAGSIRRSSSARKRWPSRRTADRVRRRHRPRASERPVSLRGESCTGHGGVPGPEGVQGRREQYRGVRDRSVHRRANTDPARRDARHPSAHVSHRAEWTPARGPTQSSGGRERRRRDPDHSGRSIGATTASSRSGRKDDIDVGIKTMFWMGMVQL